MRGLGGMTGLVSEAGKMPACYGPMGAAGGGIPAGYSYLYDADANVYSDAGSTLAGNNDSVQQWNDQVGTAPMKQSTADNRPTYLTNQVNGHAAIRWDGSADWMAPDADAWQFTSEVDSWTVLKIRAYTNLARAFQSAGGPAVDITLALSSPDAVSNICTGQIAFSAIINSWFLYRVYGDASASAVVINNGAPVAGGNPAKTGQTKDLVLGADAAHNNVCQVDIAYHVDYSSVLSAEDASTLQTWLNDRFALW